MEVSYTQVIFTIERSILKILYKIEVKCYLLFMCESISAASNPPDKHRIFEKLGHIL